MWSRGYSIAKEENWVTHWRGSNCVLDLIETPYEAKGGFVLSLCLFQACVIVLPCYHLAAVGETIQYRHLTRFETSLVFLFLTFFSLFFCVAIDVAPQVPPAPWRKPRNPPAVLNVKSITSVIHAQSAFQPMIICLSPTFTEMKEKSKKRILHKACGRRGVDHQSETWGKNQYQPPFPAR